MWGKRLHATERRVLRGHMTYSLNTGQKSLSSNACSMSSMVPSHLDVVHTNRSRASKYPSIPGRLHTSMFDVVTCDGGCNVGTSGCLQQSGARTALDTTSNTKRIALWHSSTSTPSFNSNHSFPRSVRCARVLHCCNNPRIIVSAATESSTFRDATMTRGRLGPRYPRRRDCKVCCVCPAL